MSSIEINGKVNLPQKRKTSFVLLSLLLIIRIILINLIRLWNRDVPYWVNVSYELAVYLLIFLFIWLNQDDLPRFHLDKLSIIVIILFSSILRIETKSYPYLAVASIGFWVVSLGLLVILVRNWSKLPIVKIKWIIVSILVGFALPVLFNFLLNHEFDIVAEFESPGHFLYYSLFVAINQLGHAPIQEEILFRGLLWGYLLRLGWDDKRIWLLQAFLFLLAHLYYLQLGIVYWLYTGIIGLALGLLAWRSRSIVPGTIAHTIYNGISFSLEYLTRR